MNTIWITITIIILILNIKDGVCYVCTTQAIAKCFESLEDVLPGEALTYSYGYGSKALSRESWMSFCSIYNNEVSGCLDRIVPLCSDYLMKMYQGMEDGITYMCNEGYQDFLKYADCFSSNITQAYTVNCMNQLLSRTYMVAVNSKKETCSLLDNTVECVTGIIEESCGKEASEWVAKVDSKALGPLRDYLNCSKMKVGHLVAAIVGSIIGTAILLASLYVLVTAARKKRRIGNVKPLNLGAVCTLQADYDSTANAKYPYVFSGAQSEKEGPLPSCMEMELPLKTHIQPL